MHASSIPEHPLAREVDTVPLTAGPSGPGGPSTSIPYTRGRKKRQLAWHIFKVTLTTGLESPTLYLFLNISGLAARSRHPRAEGFPLSGWHLLCPHSQRHKSQIILYLNHAGHSKTALSPSTKPPLPQHRVTFLPRTLLPQLMARQRANPGARPALLVLEREKSSSSGRSCF